MSWASTQYLVSSRKNERAHHCKPKEKEVELNPLRQPIDFPENLSTLLESKANENLKI
jgi:hypothetical protein